MKEKVLRIADLVLDDDLYPRFKTGWLTVYQYAMAMKSGSEFPPVVVGKFQDKLFVVDGWHRIEALKLLKQEYVRAIVKNYENKVDLFVDAVRSNVTHGRQLSIQEKARIIDKLESYSFTREQISEIVRVPVDKIERFKLKVVTLPDGSKVYVKSVVEDAVEGNVKLVGDVDQKLFNVRNVESLLEQLAELLRSGILNFEDEKVMELATEVYRLLGESLKLKLEA